jgi:hypothetical protein
MFGDQVGFSILLQEHAYEHVQFVQKGQAAAPERLIPDYDLASWENTKPFALDWLNTHETVHGLLREWTGVSGINLADVDLSKEDEFYQWLDAHRVEHIALRHALGIS